MKDDHLVLVTAEHHVLENYFSLQEFHNDLLTECLQRDSTPYPDLIVDLDSMRFVMNKMNASRARFYNQNLKVREDLESTLKRGKKVPESVFEDLQLRLRAYNDSASAYDAEFRVYENRYRSTIEKFGIRFISHSNYAESLVARIISWEDSLSVQNLRIAAARAVLNDQGWDNRSDQFRKAYLPLSEMELNRKVLLSKLTGLNNAHNRYEVARPEEGFYVGPFIVERHDVIMVEAIFPQLDSIMGVFRSDERLFYSGIN
ncbi:MAG: hypothetical protein GC193_12265 [Cryomorphaceae bacterium]|nr:hypothetical protein [Cryomorphaceae bacterium]